MYDILLLYVSIYRFYRTLWLGIIILTVLVSPILKIHSHKILVLIVSIDIIIIMA